MTRAGTSIRRAGPADLAELARLSRLAIEEQRQEKGGDVWSRREARQEPVERSFDAQFDGDNAVWLASWDGAPIGYAVAGVEALADGTTIGAIHDLYVEAEAREVGVGEALMAEVVAWCGERGCVGIDGWALPGDRETKNFFETFGFTARGIVVHHRLTGA
jgi:GNAT superfamily N-acetyltransferase